LKKNGEEEQSGGSQKRRSTSHFEAQNSTISTFAIRRFCPGKS
jgi:hypothetical protein